MSRFFIDRPIFAWVIAIILMLCGGLAILTLPVSQYPSIAPPAVSITAIYPGADAQTVTSTVTQPIEQQMKGLDHLEYLSSTGDSSGTSIITLTFAQGTNPDIAQVQVQNKLQLATPVLPQEVQQQGVIVAKATQNFLLGMAVYSETGEHTSSDLADLVNSRLLDPLSRVNGVGDTTLFGAQYAMRIWVDPYKLNNYNLTVGDVKAAVVAQNAQIASGQVGGLPSVKEQQLNAVVTSQSRLQTPEQFRNILLKTNQDGSTVYMRDVARVEMGQDNYSVLARFNRHPAGGLGIKPAPGANALAVVKAVKERVNEIAKTFPSDVKVAFPYDTTPFVRLSIEDVVRTLFEAVVLVFVVMFLFLQNWRATLIPTIAVPVVLLGTFGVLAAFGYSINTLTMFAMVLAIGLLVDDAIVVVENVERIMDEEHLSPRDATRKSMDEITGALIGIVLVLVAVFLPMAFFGGSTGVIYRQFAITLVSALVLSVLVALILTPALCATLLKPRKPGEHTKQRGFFGWFNRTFDKGVQDYEGALRHMTRRWVPYTLVYLVVVAAMALLFVRLPTGFLPDDDQGVAFTLVQLPAGATMSRTLAAEKVIEDHFLDHEKQAVSGVFCIAGFSFAGQGQNVGLCFVPLKPIDQRPGATNKAQALVGRAFATFSKVRDAMIIPLTPPPVQELGNATGFDFYLQDRANLGHDALVAAQGQMLGMASKDPTLLGVRPNNLPDTPQLKVDIDQPKATALGLSIADVNDTLGTAWGSSYVNDFIDRGRVKHVYVQGDAPFRGRPEDLDRWYVRGASNSLAPFSAFATSHWLQGASQIQRYNGFPALEIQGQPVPGVSSGAAMAKIETMAKKLPPGFNVEWTGLSFEERSGGSQAPMLFGLSIIVVFLSLAALYESWSVPVAVLLVVPLGIIGAVLAVTLRHFSNDVFFQVGLLTTMGLAAKNAILIVEFAELAMKQGKTAIEAAIEAAKLRLRPILMTSLAFVVGVMPLAISNGAGSGAQNDIGTGVVGGMIGATVLAIFFVPLFYVLVRKVAKGRPVTHSPAVAPGQPPVEGA
ncbi:MAG: efflux RND transporter permease subunit [Caulobacteraceae bacterium]